MKNSRNKLLHWQTDFYQRSLVFQDIKKLCLKTDFKQWPSCEQLNLWLKKDLFTPLNKKIQFHRPFELLDYETPDCIAPETLYYEEKIYQTGKIETREENWHDFFNACIWSLFPQTKLYLNYLHIQEMQQQQGKKRTLKRDVITHLDESGLIIVSSQKQLFEDLKNHRWQEVFVLQRYLWGRKIEAFIFGHGIYEKALSPFVGLTAKAYCLLVDDAFFNLDKQKQYQLIDHGLKKDIEKNNSLATSKVLSPLPILGVPGWFEENKKITFYDDLDYFRPKK